jgi:hypothetical protein
VSQGHDPGEASGAAARSEPESTRRGLLIIQLDGVAPGVLRVALRRGPMPALRRLLATGHRFTTWMAGIPAQTSSSQAAIMYGDDFDIPGFRWYEKETRRLVVSNHPADAALIERRAAREHGILAMGGSSVANLVSGGAGQSTLTMSTLVTGASAYVLSRWILNPRFLVAELFLMIREVLIEVGQATRQRVRNIRPRVRRGGSVPFLRAISNVMLRDLTTSVLLSNLRAGLPVMYGTYVGYDVVAHHAGPSTPDAIKALAQLDLELARLFAAADAAPRRYDVVVLSDHGQSTSAPFRIRYGRRLEEVVSGLAAGSSVSSAGGTTETWGHLNEVLSASVQGDRPSARRARRYLAPRIRDGYVEVGPDRLAARPDPADLVVCASGNLAHVYLTNLPGRVPLETTRELHPGLVEGLIDHRGIEFVMGQAASGSLVLSRYGARNLDDGSIQGLDPLAGFGSDAIAALRRLNEFPHTGDLVLNGRVDKVDGVVAAFEDLAGSHGGLGGPQSEAFLIAPDRWNVPDRLPSGHAIHELLAKHVPGE